jgi:hypothetical protein
MEVLGSDFRARHDWVVEGPQDGVVQAWSVVRLPYQPKKGPSLDLCQRLRHCVRLLSDEAGPGYALTATYTSADPTPGVDAENILFYNVGSGFGRPSRILIERSYQVPPMYESEVFLHHHRYQVGDAGTSSWVIGDAICEWEAPLINGVTSLEKPAGVWYSVRKQARATHGHVPIGQPFAVSVTVAGPEVSHRRLTDVMKPVLDGVISAFHVHNGRDLEELSRRLDVDLNVSPAEVARTLMNADATPLGVRRLLWGWRQIVQWNPADDRCVHAAVGIAQETRWSLRVRLSSVRASHAA